MALASFPPYTEENYLALAEAVASGAKSVRYGNKEITYQDTEKMEALLEKMAAYLGYKKPGGGRSYAEFCKF